MKLGKNLTFTDGGSWKTNVEERGLPKKGGIGQFADLRGLGKEEGGGIFEGEGDTPMHTMANYKTNEWFSENFIAVEMT